MCETGVKNAYFKGGRRAKVVYNMCTEPCTHYRQILHAFPPLKYAFTLISHISINDYPFALILAHIECNGRDSKRRDYRI